MHDIEMQSMSPEFLKCWQAAGVHLNNQVDGGIQPWLRAHPYPSFLEHLSFRLGNQLFFIRVEGVDRKVEGPGSLRGLHFVAQQNRGRACLMPMKKRLFGGKWVPTKSGWRLVEAITKNIIGPVALLTEDKIEMTSLELQDMAVQVGRRWHGN